MATTMTVERAEELFDTRSEATKRGEYDDTSVSVVYRTGDEQDALACAEFLRRQGVDTAHVGGQSNDLRVRVGFSQIVEGVRQSRRYEGHDCEDHPVQYQSDGALGHGWECGRCGRFLQAG